MRYPRLAILGPGLLGGSVALAAKDVGHQVMLWGRRSERVEQTRALGLEATTDLAEAVTDADLIIFAVPVGAMAPLAEQFLPIVKPTAVVTDVGSVKQLPHAQLDPIFSRRNIPFMGSHPMAGSEQTGIEAARGDLFTDAACVVTPGNNSEAAAEQLANFWRTLGCRVLVMSPGGHDKAVARISHFPHAMAVLTAELGLRFSGDASLAGGGFRDTSRVASGDPAMWAEIMTENRAALIPVLREAQDSLREMLVMLEDSDDEGLRKFLAEVKARRDAIGSPDPS